MDVCGGTARLWLLGDMSSTLWPSVTREGAQGGGVGQWAGTWERGFRASLLCALGVTCVTCCVTLYLSRSCATLLKVEMCILMAPYS